MNIKYLKCFSKVMHTISVVIISSSLFAAGSIAVAEENHDASHHFHKNHFALFLGTTQPDEDGERTDAAFTVGIDYERRLSKLIGVGFLADVVTGGNREYLLGIPLFLHVGKHAKFQIAPGWHKVDVDQAKGLVLRAGFIWDFEVGKNTISPSIYYDITEHENLFVVGVGIGRGW